MADTSTMAKVLKEIRAEAEAAKYVPDPNIPQPEGRDPVATIPTHDAEKAVDLRKTKEGREPRATVTTGKVGAELKKKLAEERKKLEDARKAAEQKKRDESLRWMTANEDGTFKPPEKPPTTLAELKKTTPVPNDRDWAAGKLVKVGSKKYTWKKSGGWTETT